jgi:hypothetical protein
MRGNPAAQAITDILDRTAAEIGGGANTEPGELSGARCRRLAAQRGIGELPSRRSGA